jgi:hypothetical protein
VIYYTNVLPINIDRSLISEPTATDALYTKWLKRIGSFICSVLSLPFV